MSCKRKYCIPVFLLLLLCPAGAAAQQPDMYFLTQKNFSIFSDVYESIALEYVDEVDPELIIRHGIKAMLETLDPYTVLFDESQNEAAEIFSRGSQAGIGLETSRREGAIVVIAPLDGGPAQKAGIKAGDEIIAVDGVSTQGLQPEEIALLTSGQAGSEVSITIRRYGFSQALEFTLRRERIEASNISYAGLIGEDSKTGYIRLAQFGNRASAEFRTALTELAEQTDLNGLIIDLRDNPGGILQEAVSIIDKFVEPGITVVETRGRIAEYNQTFETSEPVSFQQPLVVLINNGSASASEILAGALQDLDRALIIGEQSFGKGLVQIVKPMPYNTSLKITISRYFIPSGRSIQSVLYTHESRNSGIRAETSRKEFKTRNGRIVYEGRGIEPDILSAKKKDGQLGYELLNSNLIFDFATRYQAEHDTFTADALPDDVYVEFIAYLKEHSFDYQTNAEKTLAELEAHMDTLAEAQNSITQLKAAIKKQKEESMVQLEEVIQQWLFLELVSRYYGEEGRIKANLKSDTDVLTALGFITQKSKMDSLLSGQ